MAGSLWTDNAEAAEGAALGDIFSSIVISGGIAAAMVSTETFRHSICSKRSYWGLKHRMVPLCAISTISLFVGIAY